MKNIDTHKIIWKQSIAGGGGSGRGSGSLLAPAGVSAKGYSGVGYGIGKGLIENGSPFLQVMIFGHPIQDTPINDPGSWTVSPTILDPVTTLDVSSLTPNCEAIVALELFSNVTGVVTVLHNWYRTADNALLFTFSGSTPDPTLYGYTYWTYCYMYSYIGYIMNPPLGPKEICQNGQHHADLYANSVMVASLPFSVVGVPAGSTAITAFSVNYDIPTP